MVFSCRMCGSPLEVEMDRVMVSCIFCGQKQTYPKSKNESVMSLFNHANELRQKCEFDKAEEVYDVVREMDDSDPEVYWGALLCRYGIEYVKDPGTSKRVPTCHRTVLECVEDQEDFQTLLKLSDPESIEYFRGEAEKIDGLQQEIMTYVSEGLNYDVFICYKQLDSNGKRTEDSYIAEKLYDCLTDSGKINVFYAAKTLEKKLGEEFEPFIFTGLSTAKVMVVIGTRQDYFEAVWLRNEWARYIRMMKIKPEKMLIPAFRGKDASIMPKELAAFQGISLDDEDAIEKLADAVEMHLADLDRVDGISSDVLPDWVREEKLTPEAKKGYYYLSVSSFQAAQNTFYEILSKNNQDGWANFGRLLVEMRLNDPHKLGEAGRPLHISSFYTRTLESDLSDKWKEIIRKADQTLSAPSGKPDTPQLSMEEKERLYVEAKKLAEKKDYQSWKQASHIFTYLGGYKDSVELARRYHVDEIDEGDSLSLKDSIMKFLMKDL